MIDTDAQLSTSPLLNRVQQCFAVAAGADEFLDVARTTFCRITDKVGEASCVGTDWPCLCSAQKEGSLTASWSLALAKKLLLRSWRDCKQIFLRKHKVCLPHHTQQVHALAEGYRQEVAELLEGTGGGASQRKRVAKTADVKVVLSLCVKSGLIKDQGHVGHMFVSLLSAVVCACKHISPLSRPLTHCTPTPINTTQVQYSNKRGFYMCAPLPTDTQGNVASLPFPK